MSLLMWVIVSALLLPHRISAASAGDTRWRLPSRRGRDWLDTYARRSGLPLPEELRQPVLQRMAERERWSRRGGATGMVLGAVLVLVMGWQQDHGMLVLITMMLGAGLGGALAIIRGKHQISPEAPRYARAQATSLADYLSHYERLAMRLAPVTAALAAFAAVLILHLGSFGRPENNAWAGWVAAMWLCLGLTILSWMGTEVLLRYVLAQPQRARSELELAWDDHSRSQALRETSGLPVLFSWLTALTAVCAVGLVVTSAEVREGAAEETLVAGAVMLAGGLVAVAVTSVPLILAAARGARHHVLRRLWAGHPFHTAPAQEHL